MFDGDRFGVGQFSRSPVKVLKDHLRMWIGDQAFAPKLFWHVKDIVDLNNTEVGVQTLQSWQVWQDIATPADITFPGPKFELSGRGAITLVIDRDVIHAVVGSAAEFPDVVGNFDGKTVMQVACHDKNFLAKLVPCVDEHFAFIKETLSLIHI